MPTLVQVKELKQLEPIKTGVADVLVTFDVLGLIFPDSLVQIYASGRSDTSLTPADLKDEVELQVNEHVGYSTILHLQAGAFLFLHFCPRTTTNGVLDPDIDAQPFDSFCTVIPLTTRAVLPPSPGALAAPVITSIEPHQATLHNEGSIVVRWSASNEFDKYHFMFTDSFPPPKSEVGFHEIEIEAPRSHGFSFRIQPAFARRTYTFKVQGCKESEVFPDECSAFSPDSTATMPKNTNSLREFLRFSNVQLNPGIRSLGAAAFSAGIRGMMRL